MEKLFKSIRSPIIVLLCIVISSFVFVGCSTKASTPEQLKNFDTAGPGVPKICVEGDKAKSHTGPYRVVPGDLLEFQLPPVLRAVSSEVPDSSQNIEPYLCRVDYTGNITLPIIGQLFVLNKELPEIELLVANAYCPKYVVTPLAVVCQIKEYHRETAEVFTVMGLVNHSNTFAYPSNVRYNLMESLAFAGGLNMVADPRYVKIFRQDANGKVVCATVSIRGEELFNAYAVLIKPGDVVFVDHTFQTRTNTFLSQVLSIRFGADVRP